MGDIVHTHIKAETQTVTNQVIQLLEFYLAGLEGGGIDSITIEITPRRDRLGTKLHHCQILASSHQERGISIEETQSDLSLAINRALDRCVRTGHRKKALLRFDLSS